MTTSIWPRVKLFLWPHCLDESLHVFIFYFSDLSGNNINCDCSLTWSKHASFKVQLVGTCQNPVWIRGRYLANITTEDMCSK